VLEKFLHTVFTPLKWLWWRIVELMFRFQFRLSGDFLPQSRLEHDVFTGGQILSYEFRDLLQEGGVAAVRGSIARFTEFGVELADGSWLEADVVIFGTGFKKSYSYLSPGLYDQLDRQRDGLYLYRNIFPTEISDISFIGAEVSTFNNILTQGLQSLWLKCVLTGQVLLPPVAAMTEATAADKAWKRSWMPAKGDRAAILQLHKMKYHDQLCKDMGVNHKRKGWNLLAEVFAPYSAADYASLFCGIQEKDAPSWVATVFAAFILVILAAVFLATHSTKQAVMAGTAVIAIPCLVDMLKANSKSMVDILGANLKILCP